MLAWTMKNFGTRIYWQKFIALHQIYGFPDSNNTHMRNIWSLMIAVTKKDGSSYKKRMPRADEKRLDS